MMRKGCGLALLPTKEAGPLQPDPHGVRGLATWGSARLCRAGPGEPGLGGRALPQRCWVGLAAPGGCSCCPQPEPPLGPQVSAPHKAHRRVSTGAPLGCSGDGGVEAEQTFRVLTVGRAPWCPVGLQTSTSSYSWRDREGGHLVLPAGPGTPAVPRVQRVFPFLQNFFFSYYKMTPFGARK